MANGVDGGIGRLVLVAVRQELKLKDGVVQIQHHLEEELNAKDHRTHQDTATNFHVTVRANISISIYNAFEFNFA